METAVYENICTSLFADHSCYETDSTLLIIEFFESEHKPYAELNLLIRFLKKNVNLELCLSLIMHHGQKWRQEIENLLKTSNPSFIKLIMKREMSDLKGKILKLHESLFSMIFT